MNYNNQNQIQITKSNEKVVEEKGKKLDENDEDSSLKSMIESARDYFYEHKDEDEIDNRENDSMK